MPRQVKELRFAHSVGDVQRPERPQLARHVRVLAQHALEGRMHRRIRSALLQNSPRVTHVPIVAVELKVDELR